MSWLKLSLTVERDEAPVVEALLEDLGALSVTHDDAGDAPVLEPAPGRTELWETTRVTGLFPGDADAEDLRARLGRSVKARIARCLQLERLEDRQWERAWLDAFHPMRFGGRLWVCPSEHPLDQPGAVVVRLDPGLAFGTGTHPTTALCLHWLDRTDLQGMRMLDYGCGSGILAIAALLLGASRALGVDHDPQALTASRENARKNGVSERLELCSPERLAPGQADLVVANILSGPLIALAPVLTGLVRPGGRIALSGILVDQAGEVTDAYRGAFRMDPPAEQDGWVLLTGLRPEAPDGASDSMEKRSR